MSFTHSNVFKALTLLGHMAHRSGCLHRILDLLESFIALSPTQWRQLSTLLDKGFKAAFLNVTVIIFLPLSSKCTLVTLLRILELSLVKFFFCQIAYSDALPIEGTGRRLSSSSAVLSSLLAPMALRYWWDIQGTH